MITLNSVLLANLPAMRAYARKICSKADVAEDVLQDACVTVLGTSKSPDDITGNPRWLLGHVKFAKYRRHRNDNSLALDGGAAAALAKVSGGQFEAVEISEIERIVETLGARTLEAFHLTAEGNDSTEVGEAMGISRQRAHVHIQKFRTAIAV